MSTIPLCTHRYIGLRNSCWAEISVFLMIIHDCTRMLGTCYGQQHVLSLSSQKHTQVRKAHCSWQELLLHAERCMRHEDVVKKILLAGLNCTWDEWLCDSFVELIEEMELWKWDDATGDFWSGLAKALQQSNISVTWAQQLDSRLASVHATGKMS